MADPPKGRVRKLTDEDLRRDFYDEGLTKAEIARKWGVSPANVTQRIQALEEKTVAVTVAPEEAKRFAGAKIDAMEELSRSLRRVNLLMDACDEWLRDADDPTKYDVGPRAHEIPVTYWKTAEGGMPVKKKERLGVLLAGLQDTAGIIATEVKVADPRELILKTAQEVRQTVNTLVELGQLLASLQSMERYREHFLDILAKVDPAVAQRLVEAVRSDLLLNPAFGGSGTLPQ